MTCNTFDSPSTKYSTSALTTDQLASRIKTFGELLAEEKNPALKYDSAFLSSAIVGITAMTRVINNTSPGSYTQLVNRVEAAPITASEIADFIDTTGNTVESITFAIQVFNNSNQTSNGIDSANSVMSIVVSNLLEQLDIYYTESFGSSISNGFCATFSGILTGLAGLMGAFSAAQSFINGILGKFGSIITLLQGLVDTIKEKMLSVLDGIRSAVSGFVNMAKQFSDAIRDAANFFSDLNMQKLKDKISALISGIGSKFEQITPEVLAYLLFRFCQLTSAIESFMRSPIQGVQDMMLRHTQAMSIFTNMSDSAKLAAIAAGAFRMDEATIQANKQKITDLANRQADQTRGSTVKPSVYYTKPFEQSEIQAALSIIGGNFSSPYFDFSDVLAESDGDKTVTMLRIDIIIVALRIAKRMGRKLYIISAYRSPEKNANTEGAAKDSLHMTGLAFDISWTGSGITTSDERERFIAIASQEGVGGMSTYPTFIHIDVGTRRTWPTDANGTSMRHAEAIALHVADRFRNG
jgi:hypothetical protein